MSQPVIFYQPVPYAYSRPGATWVRCTFFARSKYDEKVSVSHVWLTTETHLPLLIQHFNSGEYGSDWTYSQYRNKGE